MSKLPLHFSASVSGFLYQIFLVAPKGPVRLHQNGRSERGSPCCLQTIPCSMRWPDVMRGSTGGFSSAQSTPEATAAAFARPGNRRGLVSDSLKPLPLRRMPDFIPARVVLRSSRRGLRRPRARLTPQGGILLHTSRTKMLSSGQRDALGSAMTSCCRDSLSGTGSLLRRSF